MSRSACLSLVVLFVSLSGPGCNRHSGDSPDLSAMLKKADDQLAAQSTDDAIKTLSQAVTRYPDATEPLVALANAYAKAGKDMEAVRTLDQLAKIDPKGWRAPLGRAMVYSRRGQHPLAIKEFEEALRLGAPEASCRLEYGISLGRVNEYQRAIDLFTKEIAAKSPDRIAATFNRAIAERASKKYEAARDDLASVLSDTPDHLGALRVAVELYLADDAPGVRDPKRALELATRIRDLDPKDPYALRAAAKAFYANGDPEAAMKLADKAIDYASALDRRQIQEEYLRYKFEAGPDAAPTDKDRPSGSVGSSAPDRDGGTGRSK